MERRRKYFINRKIQGLYVTITSLAVLLTSATVGFAVYCLFFSSFVEQVGAVNLTLTNFKFVTSRDMVYLGVIFIALWLASVCIGLFFVFFTHRIVGPLVRLKAGFDAVRNGDYSVRIKFRKYDYLHEIADSFNKMVDSLKRK